MSWPIFAAESQTQFPSLLIPAILLLAVFCYLKLTEKRRALRKLEKVMKQIGYTDEDLEKIEQDSKEALESREKKEAEETGKKASAAENAKAFPMRAEPTRIQISAPLASSNSFPTEKKHQLECGPGAIESEILFKGPYELEDGVHLIELETLVTDEDGSEWSATSFIDPANFLDDFTGACDAEYQGWDELTEAEKTLARERCQIANVSTLLDSRSYADITVSGIAYPFFEKYQEPHLDLCWDDEKSEWICRVSQLYRDIREDTHSNFAADDDETIPAFILHKEAGIASLFVHPELHCATPEELWEEPEDRKIPLVFKRTGKKARKQENVKHRETEKDGND